jgi:hypothetical protein
VAEVAMLTPQYRPSPLKKVSTVVKGKKTVNLNTPSTLATFDKIFGELTHSK